MTETHFPPLPTPHGPSRRSLLRQVGAAGLATGGAGLLTACGVRSASSGTGAAATGTKTLTIGYVSPKTGFAAGFGDVDPFVIDQFKSALKGGLTIGSTTYQVDFLLKDSQSDPQHAASVTQELIAGGVDLMLGSSTPETVNPVADACEAARVPCITAVCPWEAFYFGRGATPDKPFKYTYHFFIGVAEIVAVYKAVWLHGVTNNHKVGVLWPNDADGNAIRKGVTPMLANTGLTIVDPGAFPDGTQDFSALISKFKAAKVEVVNSFAIPPDFATFWQQAAQQGFKPRIASIAKTGLLPSQVEALGALGLGLTTGIYWHPTFPTKSAILGQTSQQLADAYESSTGRQWTQNLGTTVALFETAIHALRTTADPKDKEALAATLPGITLDTTVGTLDWTKGPVKNVAVEPLVAGKWVKGTGKYPVQVEIIDNSTYPAAPVQAKDSALT